MMRPLRAALQRAAAIGLLSAFFLLSSSGVATASDPAVPTNYKSTVFTVSPNTGGAEFSIVGGDAFMQIAVAPGHTALVPGYFDEPYIRIDADGTVWVNHDSPAHYINQDRFGDVSAPADADGKGEPRWEHVASEGRYAWQDHRVHWMSHDLPPTVAGDRYKVVFPWELPVWVDGVEVIVGGELVWIPTRSALGPVLAGVLGLFPLIFWNRMSLGSAAVIAGLATCIAFGTTLVQYRGTPVWLRGLPFGMVLPLAAAVLIVAATAYRGSRGRAYAFLAASGLALVAWGGVYFGVVRLPVLPSSGVADLQRVAVALVMWMSAAVSLLAGIWLLQRGRV